MANKTPRSKGKKIPKKLRAMKTVKTPRKDEEDNEEPEEEKMTPPMIPPK